MSRVPAAVGSRTDTAPVRTRTVLTAEEAVRTALAAQQLTGPRPGPSTDRGHVRRLVERIGALQIDSVTVVARAHLLPVRSRLGAYPQDVLAAATSAGPGTRRPVAWEYWGHEASFVGAEALAALRWRMHQAEEGAWGGMVEVARRRPELLPRVLDALADGPRTARQLQAVLEPTAQQRTGEWGWNWSDVKRAVEFSFWAGRVASAGRSEQFERRYTLPERVWPAAALTTPVPSPEEAADTLVDLAGRALGVATAADLRDHFRLPLDLARGAVARAQEAGRLVPVQVVGWGGSTPLPAWRHASVGVPRSLPERPGTLLAPSSRPSIRSSGTGPGPSACSGSATAWRSTCRRRVGSTATTCCPSCTAVVWWPGWTSRPTVPGASSWSARPGESPATTGTTSWSWPPSARVWARGSAAGGSRSPPSATSPPPWPGRRPTPRESSAVTGAFGLPV